MTGVLYVLTICFGITFGILAIIFLVVPLLKALGWFIGGFFNALGWVVRHVFEFVGGMLKDSVRFVGAIIAFVVLLPLVLVNVIIGRWSASGHFARSMKRECGVATNCLYRVALQRPLRFLLLGGLLEGLEERVNEAIVAAPTSDKPRRRTGSFDGYTIVGSLPGGGSGAKLYIAEPDARRLRNNREMPEKVVIKSFALTEGSSLPQILRESRALEAAKQLGLVLEHGMDEQRFFYVMPYHHGDHLGIVTRQLHGQSDRSGLDQQQLGLTLGYMEDLLQTLSRYHQGGLWHKDVKPDNIIVHSGRAHLVDLGLVTPLRSAMTLTTHGTEYFRDPEMVRMALRGVKVHQVDGAKFDIYATGAVLYFLIENTFPAHGGLSSFAKRSPESIRWIVRRAMADYNKRYETAAVMLTDLRTVAAASDIWTVKPADLPSMKGSEAVAQAPPEPAPAQVMPEPVVVAAAGSPVPPKQQEPQDAPGTPADPGYSGWGVAAGRGGVQAFKLGAAKPPKARPPIQVTNWWTGAYEVADPGQVFTPGGAQAARADAREFRQQVHSMRGQSAVLRQQVRQRVVTARSAAKEQIRNARARAREIRRRAREHRYATVAGVAKPAERAPSAMMSSLTLAVVLAVSLAGFILLQGHDTHSVDEVLAMSSIGVPYPEAPLLAPVSSLLVINDHPAAADRGVQARIARIVQMHRDLGWEVIVDDRMAEVEVRKYLPLGALEPGVPNLLLRNALLDFDLGGIIRIKSVPGEGPPNQRFEAVMIAAPVDEDAPFVRLVIPVMEK